VRSLPALTGTVALSIAVAWVCAAGAPAPATAPPPRTSGAINSESPDLGVLALGRAAFEQSAGNPQGVIDALAGIDFTGEPGFAGADRAAFLLGRAYLALGSEARFVRLARSVSGWRQRSDYTRWLSFRLAVLDSRTGMSGGVRDMSGSGRDGVGAVALYLDAIATATIGQDNPALWARLSTADTISATGRDLAGLALIRRATAALERGEDPRPLLAQVPAGSRYAMRAGHMTGLVAIERGEREAGARALAALDSTYEGRREASLTLAGLALGDRNWNQAHGAYRAVEANWASERERLTALRAAGQFDTLWTAWRANGVLSDAVTLDGGATEAWAESLARGMGIALPPPAHVPNARTAAATGTVEPTTAEWDTVMTAARQRAETRHALERAQWKAARERERLASLRGYLGTGAGRTRTEVDELARRGAFLDSLRLRLDALDARIRGVRDAATRRVLERTSSLLARCVDELLWIHGMRHFHVDGPNRSRTVAPPAGYPDPEALLASEEHLTKQIRDFLDGMAAKAPGLIARSYEKAWGPGMIDRAVTLGGEATEALYWARAIATSIDSSVAVGMSSDSLRALEARAARLAASEATLATAEQSVRDRIARAALTRGIESLEIEREAIDYGLAASTYGLAVQGSLDSTGEKSATRVARSDSAGALADAELDDPAIAAHRAEAIESLRAFLARHPQSFARGEMRFRLADLLMVDARADFNRQMAAYLKNQSEGRRTGSLPVLTHDPTLALYRSILAEDPAFEHLDAVRFNAAMILADQGSPEAETLFADLVRLHPESPYVQESWLRMGDMRFQERQFAQAVEFYQKAANGPDASLEAMALYKMGWAHFNDDKFMAAADAFRSVLDLYASGRRVEIQADIENEAEQYLVHSLAGAGGAKAFATYFDKLGHRPYETKVLLALGMQLRKLGLHEDAAAVDQLGLERYPEHPDALASARRLVDTRLRLGGAGAAREARLAHAARFAPGGAWWKAQASDSMRAEGAAFAQTAWRVSAVESHQAARKTHSPDDWRAALALYDTLLTRFPADSASATFALGAGESAEQLGDHPTALARYEVASRSSVDSLASLAAWQKVAVLDSWYRDTRGTETRDGVAVGRDSLARLVLQAGDQLLTRFPNHAKSSDLMWRQGQIAYAHGWNEQAVTAFDKLVTTRPNDPRVPRAAGLHADALFQLERFDQAGAAYERARDVARTAGVDSLVRRADKSIPVAWFRHAEQSVARDSSDHVTHAQRYALVAERWPSYEYAHRAQYRAGLAWLAAGRTAEGVAAMEGLITRFPKSEYVRDAHLQVAQAWKAKGDREQSAAAWVKYAEKFPADTTAGPAWLEAADLYAAAGKQPKADSLRLAYIQRWPNDQVGAMEILEVFAQRQLDSVGTGRSVSTLLKKPAKGATPSHLSEYLRRAAERPDLASHPLVARTRFLEAEEAYAAYDAVRITQPLKTSLPKKQKALDDVMARYAKTAGEGVPEWRHASSFRTGQALAAFGEALERSDKPADLQGDDRLAYEEVLREKAQPFYDRAEQVWTDMLRQAGSEKSDPWVERAQSSLWQRLAGRFYFRPEVDYPRIAGTPPEPVSVKEEKQVKKDSAVAQRKDEN
jgi:tetratricopeptide (TPR) repeat protein